MLKNKFTSEGNKFEQRTVTVMGLRRSAYAYFLFKSIKIYDYFRYIKRCSGTSNMKGDGG